MLSPEIYSSVSFGAPVIHDIFGTAVAGYADGWMRFSALDVTAVFGAPLQVEWSGRARIRARGLFDDWVIIGCARTDGDPGYGYSRL